MPILKLNQISRYYAKNPVVNNLSFTINRGESVAILGPNGAGKTTTLSMICGLLKPSQGCIELNEEPLCAKNQKHIGLVPQELALYDELSVLQNFQIFSALYQLSTTQRNTRIQSLAHMVGLEEKLSATVKDLSGGMKRRLNIAVSLLHEPSLILFDEPTVGVDPQSRNAIFDNILELKKQGATILYTTHYMEEAEKLCDRVIIIDHGQLVVDESLHSLKQKLNTKVILHIDFTTTVHKEQLAQVWPNIDLKNIESTGTHVKIELQSIAQSMHALQQCQTGALMPSNFYIEQHSLESLFLHLTGKEQRNI